MITKQPTSSVNKLKKYKQPYLQCTTCSRLDLHLTVSIRQPTLFFLCGLSWCRFLHETSNDHETFYLTLIVIATIYSSKQIIRKVLKWKMEWKELVTYHQPRLSLRKDWKKRMRPACLPVTAKNPVFNISLIENPKFWMARVICRPSLSFSLVISYRESTHLTT